jgi:transcription termination factor Rho
VSQTQIRKFALRTGDVIAGQVRAPKDSEKYFALLRIDEINGEAPNSNRMRIPFTELTPLFPLEKINL